MRCGAAQDDGCASMLLLRLHARRLERGQQLLNVGAPACLQHQFNLDVLRRQHREGALVMRFLDVRTGFGHGGGGRPVAALFLPPLPRSLGLRYGAGWKKSKKSVCRGGGVVEKLELFP